MSLTPEEIKVRAERAAQLLRDPMLTGALDAIEANIIATWEMIPEKDVAAREDMWKYYKLSKEFRSILRGAVQSGNVVIMQEQKRKTMPEKVLNKINEFRQHLR